MGPPSFHVVLFLVVDYLDTVPEQKGSSNNSTMSKNPLSRRGKTGDVHPP